MSDCDYVLDDGGEHDRGEKGEGTSEERPHPKDPLLVSLAGVAGNVMEWFDFAAFGYFSDVISEEFFPPDQGGHVALVQSFAVFGLAFLARPFGGAIIGQLGDRLGRKRALETALLFMAVPTFAMGCLPTFSQVGYLSTALLIICRVAQGLSVGGQVMTSVVFTMERKPRSQWGMWGSAVMAAASAGVALGSLFSYVLRSSLDDDRLNAWGWRVPFFFGVLGVVPALYLKKHGKEHHVPGQEDVSAEGSEDRPEPPDQRGSIVAEAFSRENRLALLAATLVNALPAATYYILFIWLAIYMETIADPPVPHAFLINTVVGLLGIGGQILGGWIADRHGDYVRQMVLGGIALAASAPPLLLLVARGDPWAAFSCQCTLGLFLVVWSGAMLPWMVASFPPSLRLTSVSIGYNIAVTLFGGFTPAMATLLVDNYGILGTGLFVTALGVLSILGLFLAPKGTVAAREIDPGLSRGLTKVKDGGAPGGSGHVKLGVKLEAEVV